MRTVWITRSFLDYRIPVYRELSMLLGMELVVVYNADVVPDRVRVKVIEALGSKAIGLKGEWQLGRKTYTNHAANSGIRLPWQPGLLPEVRRHKPEVLITDGFFQWTAAALWLRITERIPHVLCYERTADTERNAQWYRRFYRRWALRYVDAMCCNGRLCGEYARQIGMPAERITYGQMAADTNGLCSGLGRVTDQHRADLRRRFSLRGTCLLYVGRLTIEKGLRQLLAAWIELDLDVRAAASLLLVGDGRDRTYLESFCKTNNCPEVHFAGPIDYDQLPAFYAVADAFVIPTLEDNWSLVVPEAMACGLPVLCSKYNGCWPELVRDELNGWVFDPVDPQDTVRCLERCLRQAHRLPSMGSASEGLVRNYTPRRAAESIIEACRIAVASRQSRDTRT